MFLEAEMTEKKEKFEEDEEEEDEQEQGVEYNVNLLLGDRSQMGWLELFAQSLL